jgi:hypothetical protein
LEHWGSNRGRVEFLSSSQVYMCSEAYPAPNAEGSGIVFSGYSSQGVKLTTRIYPVLRLRLRGAILQLPIHLLDAWDNLTLLNFEYQKRRDLLLDLDVD